MRALIVDDERLARKELIKLLEDHPSVEVIGEAANAEEANQMVNELSPDILFLDIQMPGKTGFELLEMLDYVPLVVFTTAYDEFAIKAFEVNALDYLMKPIQAERLAETAAKLAEKVRNKTISNNSGDKKLGLDDQVLSSDAICTPRISAVRVSCSRYGVSRKRPSASNPTGLPSMVNGIAARC
jgi:two-component system LytT family response regulator